MIAEQYISKQYNWVSAKEAITINRTNMLLDA